MSKILYRSRGSSHSTDSVAPDETSPVAISDNFYFFPEPSNLILINFVKLDRLSPLPDSKEDGPVYGHFHFNIEGAKSIVAGTIEVQGAGSASAPQKNWNMKFSQDVTEDSH